MQKHPYLIALALLLLLAACKTDYPGQADAPNTGDAPIPVEVQTLSPTEQPMPVAVGGTIGSKQEARLSFKIGGVIESLAVREGQYVRKGQLLARLRTNEIDAQVAKAKQATTKLSRDLARTQQLYADSAATLENVQDLTTALDVAEQDVTIAEFNREYARIVAPVSGRIVKKLAEQGELIAPGAPVFFMVGEGQRSYVLRVGVPDRSVLRLSLGDPATVVLDAYPDDTLQASVTEIAAAADPRTGTFEVELTVQPGTRTLRNGFIGRASILPKATPAHYRLPMSSIAEGNGKVVTFYTLTDGDLVERRQARLLAFDDREVLLPLEALPPGSRVVVTGAAYLSPGAAVAVRNSTRREYFSAHSAE